MKYLFTGLILICGLSVSHAQRDTLHLSLDQTVLLAQSDAPDVQITQTAFSNDYWRYKSYLANYRPFISLNATLPNLNRSIEAITLPDGTDDFIPRSLMRNQFNLSVSQGIALTGGEIFARTGMQRIDVFATDGKDGYVTYLSTPISIGFSQPLFGFNQLRWDRIIEPMSYEESQRQYSEGMEDVAFNAANLFFQVLIAQLNYEAAQRDKANADTLYAISKGRFDVGRIAEVELLQIELNVMRADADLGQSKLAKQTSTENLRNFLGITQGVEFNLETPDDIPNFIVDAAQALDYAQRFRSDVIQLDRRLEEAKREVAQAKAQRGFSADIFASFGLSQTGASISEAYTDPLDQELFVVGLTVPIADWGKSQAVMEIARSNEELTRLQVTQDRVSFEQEILVKVQQFDQVRNQVQLASRTYEVAQKRLDITRQRYRIGNILVTDLNLAIQEEASARRAYVSALQSFWLAYYDLRRITLFDFATGKPLARSAEGSLR
ncbi:MAG: TolC family protein [Saprospiraceae bacterium]|nr:TolC family protein [Lewinella sp.]